MGKYIETFESYFKGDMENKERFMSEEASKKFLDNLPIYTEWNLPTDFQSAGKYLASLYVNNKWKEKELLKFYDKIVKLNPELKQFDNHDDTWDKEAIVHGVISKFNIDDISFFINNPNYIERNKIVDPLIEKIKGLLRRKKINTEGFPGWVPSPETCYTIIQYLERKL